MREEKPIKQARLSTIVTTLFDEQLKVWETCGRNYANLAFAESKEYSIAGEKYILQQNPARIASTAAKIDSLSIAKRPCFLCDKNRPAKQLSLPFAGYKVLVNPYPVFSRHFTIVSRCHQSQSILENFSDMLELTASFGKDYFVFYNGPRAGASAPDHLHFQAGTRAEMPLLNPRKVLRSKSFAECRVEGTTLLYFPEDGIRRFIVMEGVEKSSLEKTFKYIYKEYAKLSGSGSEEPMLNIIMTCSQSGPGFRVIIIPRAKHRPNAFFAKPPEQVVFSPAAADLAGLCIIPLKEDFDKLTGKQLSRMIREVCLSNENFRELMDTICAGY